MSEMMKNVLRSCVAFVLLGSYLATAQTPAKPTDQDVSDKASQAPNQSSDAKPASNACGEQLAAQKGAAYQVGPGITPPRGIHTPDAKYPRTAIKAKKQGVVVLCLIVTAEGKVDDVRVLRSLSPDLDDSAVRAVSSWTFAPATKEGKPVAAQIYTNHFFKIKW